MTKKKDQDQEKYVSTISLLTLAARKLKIKVLSYNNHGGLCGLFARVLFSLPSLSLDLLF